MYKIRGNTYLERTTGIYKHFKGNKYLFIAEGVDMETGNIVIIYKSIHDGTIWCRNFTCFHDWVDGRGMSTRQLSTGVRRRFELIEAIPEKEIDVKKLEGKIILNSDDGTKFNCEVSRRGNPKLVKVGVETKNKIRPLLSRNT